MKTKTDGDAARSFYYNWGRAVFKLYCIVVVSVSGVLSLFLYCF